MNPRLKRMGLSLARPPRGLRDVWLHDGSPAKHTNVLGSDRISMTSAATRYATEGGLIRAVCLVRMSAAGTTTRGVAGINRHHGNTSSLCLVPNKGSQLMERPAM